MEGLIKPWEIFPDKGLSASDGMNTHSNFLDIGSGYGFPPFMATGLTGCKSIGIEFVEGRVKTSQDFLKQLSSGHTV